MKLKDELGLPARMLYFLMGIVLGIATIASAFSQWPAVTAGKEPMLGFMLLVLIAMPLSLLIILWACVGRHREWRIDSDHIRIRMLSLTVWKRDVRIRPEQIESLSREQFSYDDEDGRIAYGITVHLRDGRDLQSPQTFSADQADMAWAKLQALHGNGQLTR